jgi:tRNA 2-thiouridine synthesizing protein A
VTAHSTTDTLVSQEVSMTIALTDTELSGITAAKVVDARGSACPGPLLEAKKGIGTVVIGSVLEIWSSDPVTKTDLSAWAAKVGHEFLGFAPADGYDRVFVRRLR